MEIVFVVGGYYPRFSATGNCIGKIANQVKQHHNIRVISEKKSIDESPLEEWNDQKIYRIATKRTNNRLNYISKNQISRLYLHKVYWFLKFLIQKYGFDMSAVDAYQDKLVMLHLEKKIDAVIPCCMPIEGVYASYLFSQKYNVRFVPILFDLYSNSDIFFRKPIIKNLKHKAAASIEQKMLSYANHIFYVDNWKTYFDNANINATEIEHPLIEKKNDQTEQLEGRTQINLIYQGEVSYEIRNPAGCILALEKLLMRDEGDLLSVHIFSFGNAYNEFEQLRDKCRKNVHLYGRVDKELSDRYCNDADLNVIIANSNPKIVPSKLFECISMGKPILYFTENIDDKPLEILKKYPNLYVFNVKTIDELSITELYNWIIANHKSCIRFEELNDDYKKATPEYIANIILEKFGENYEF